MADESAETAKGAAQAANAAPDPAASENDTDAATAVTERMLALADENADLKDRLLRAAAEMENLRRRSEREAADAKQYAITGFARELLNVADNLRRTLEAVPAEQREADETGFDKLVEGVELTERELLRVLNKHGVRQVEAEGQRFDPHFHQAIFEVEDGSVPAGTVARVVQAGYQLGERVLRPAMVGVSRRPARPPAAAAAAAEAGKSAG